MKGSIQIAGSDSLVTIGIDPGKNGGIAVFRLGKLRTYKMPGTAKDLYNLLKKLTIFPNTFCYLEKVQGLPKMGGGAMFTFGQGYGHLEMALLALKVRHETVTPQKWQKEFQIGTKGKDKSSVWKNKLKAKAQQLNPDHKINLWNADCILIAEYGRRNFK